MPTKMQRIAVVTGGGSGIGAAVAHALAGDGWTVVLAGRRREALEAVVASGSGLTGVLDAIPTDVTDEVSVRSYPHTLYGHVRLPIRPRNMPSPASPNQPRSTGRRSTSPADRSISATRRPTWAAEQRPELRRLTAPVRPEPLMDVAEVGRAVRYMADLPLDANVATMTVMATKMPFIGRG